MYNCVIDVLDDRGPFESILGSSGLVLAVKVSKIQILKFYNDIVKVIIMVIFVENNSGNSGSKTDIREKMNLTKTLSLTCYVY